MLRTIKKYIKYELSVRRIISSLPNRRKSGVDRGQIKSIFRNVTRFPITTSWHDAYASVNGINSSLYIPGSIFYSVIEGCLNRRDLVLAFEDKNYYTLTILGFEDSLSFVRNINGVWTSPDFDEITVEDAEKLIQQQLAEDGAFFVKPSILSGGGKAVIKVSPEFAKSDLAKLLQTNYISDFVCQRPIRQATEMAQLHPKSVNTLRIVTLHLNGRVSTVSTVLRMGRGNSDVDNQASGGISAGVNQKGQVNDFAVDKAGRKLDIHPDSKIAFSEVKIPNFEAILEQVESLHKRIFHFKMISWDVAIGENLQPIFIELNLKGQEINFHQFNNGPLFGDRTLEVLKEVQKVRSQNDS